MKKEYTFLEKYLLVVISLFLFALGYLWHRVDSLEQKTVPAETSMMGMRAKQMIVAEEPRKEEPVVTPGVTGSDWELVNGNAPFSARREHIGLVFQDKLWVVGGFGTNDVWCSPDGEHWTCTNPHAGFTTNWGMDGLVYQEKMWVMGGHNAEVWNSSDGKEWTKVTDSAAFGIKSAHKIFVFKGKMWLIGGGLYTNDVWFSDNGKDWICAVKSAPFIPRCGQSCVVYDNKIWLICGTTNLSGGGELKDVWSSPDGFHWTQATEEGPFTARFDSSAVNFQGKIWLMAGDAGSFHWLNDVWNTTDGKNWNCVTPRAAFSGRILQRCMVFQDRIWLIGGDHNDVWCTPRRSLSK